MTPTLLAPRTLSHPARLGASARPAAGLTFDVLEHDDRFEVQLEVPGAARDDLDLTVADRQLTVTHRRDRPADDQIERYVAVGRQHRDRSTTFRFGRLADLDGVEAALADGLLTLTVPKTADTAPRSIEIR